jgi:hypothetical protein
MTPDLLNALADVLDAIEAACLNNDHSDPYEDEAWDTLASVGDALSVALGIDADATWQETAAALRLHATTLTPGLPEGWIVSRPVGWLVFAETANNRAVGVDEDGSVYVRGAVEADVARAVLARAGVVS